MNKLEVFKFEEDKEIRTQVDANGNPLFCVKDICDMLNIGNVGSATKDLESVSIITNTKGGPQKMSYIDKSVLNKIIFKSRRKVNEKFMHWVKTTLPNLNIDITLILQNLETKKQTHASKTYLIYSKNTGLTKIGRSTDPLKRFEDIKRNRFDDTLTLLAYSELDLETTLHKQYAEYRVTYEWFKLTKELIDSIINDNNFTIL